MKAHLSKHGNGLICDICNGPMRALTWKEVEGGDLPKGLANEVWEMQTLVGYSSPPGHDHDDNCKKRVYGCSKKHKVTVSIRRTCPVVGCGWKGKEDCFCHEGKKFDEWPD